MHSNVIVGVLTERDIVPSISPGSNACPRAQGLDSECKHLIPAIRLVYCGHWIPT
ncbi:hypothetical protein BDM02DRAFT_3110280 [Thelephora ganbajun]|uniref:Uncharacterized protein n=1 Tax=Thelephora ganbajun TaxID=370292 RepID=A0ACB6ZQD5_THEGA|nr:hypothetical protein BDM02DRAFT_3110280 [Thelephora ganbajun]